MLQTLMLLSPVLELTYAVVSFRFEFLCRFEDASVGSEPDFEGDVVTVALLTPGNAFITCLLLGRLCG